jgi:hypothetical protein
LAKFYLKKLAHVWNACVVKEPEYHAALKIAVVEVVQVAEVMQVQEQVLDQVILILDLV